MRPDLVLLLFLAVAVFAHGNRQSVDAFDASPYAAVAGTQLRVQDLLAAYETEEVGHHSDGYTELPPRRDTLAYVTPWNERGYDMALHYAHRFTHLSPIWYNIRPAASSWTLDGRHNVDAAWITAVRDRNSRLKLVPRFNFDQWTEGHYRTVHSSGTSWKGIARLIIDECRYCCLHTRCG